MLTKEELHAEFKKIEPEDIPSAQSILTTLKTIGVIVPKKYEIPVLQLILAGFINYRINRERRHDARSNETELGSNTVSDTSDAGDRSEGV